MKAKGNVELLFKTERAYWYSVQLLQESNEDYRKKQHSNKRLKKAKVLAEQLAAAIDDDDVIGLLEARAYASFLSSHHLMQTQQYLLALESFQQTKAIYEKLLLVGYSAHHKTLIEQQLDEVEPCIRFCAYQLRQDFDINELLELKNDFENDLISSKIQQLVSSGLDRSETIEWRDYSVVLGSTVLECMYPIKNHIQHLDVDWKNMKPENLTEDIVAQLEKMGDVYDKIIGLYWDAFRIADKEYKEDMEATMKAKSSKSEENTARIKLVLDYISFERIQKAIERNMFLIKMNTLKQSVAEQGLSVWNTAPPKPDDNIKLCLGILKTLEEVRNLFLFETDINVQSLMENYGLYYDALKKYHFAEYYQHQGQYQHGLLCIERARQTLNDIQIEQLYKEDAIQLRTDLESFDVLLVQQECQLVAKLYLKGQTVDHVTEKVDKLSLEKVNLYHRLKSFEPIRSIPKIASLEPEPVPFRPIIYDIAYSEIDFPTKNLQKLANGGQEPVEKTFLKGVFGLWK